MPARGTPTSEDRGRLSPRATIWVVAASLAIIYVLSTIPTPLYVVYR